MMTAKPNTHYDTAIRARRVWVMPFAAPAVVPGRFT